MKKVLIILSASLLMLTACRQEHLSDSFMLNGDVRIEIKGFVTFAYDSLHCQKAFNRERREFRVHTDNVSDFFSLKLDAIPSEAGQKVSGTATWTTRQNIHSKRTSFEVLKLKDRQVWLWSGTNRIAAVVEILD